MIALPEETQPSNGNNKNEDKTTSIDKISSSATISSTLESEMKTKNLEKRQLSEQINQAELTVEQLERMIVTTTTHTNQVVNEYERVEREYAAMLKDNRLQDEYICRETGILEAELESLKTMLETCNKRLKKVNDKNAILQNEIMGSRYKIFCMHFNGLDEEQLVESDYNSTSVETSLVESTISSDSAHTADLLQKEENHID